MAKSQKSVKAAHGERMIEIKVRFWTNGIANQSGYIVPKQAWASGEVRINRNDSHGIVPKNSRIFNSLMGLPKAIEKVLIDNDIKLRIDRDMEKYLE